MCICIAWYAHYGFRFQIPKFQKSEVVFQISETQHEHHMCKSVVLWIVVCGGCGVCRWSGDPSMVFM